VCNRPQASVIVIVSKRGRHAQEKENEYRGVSHGFAPGNSFKEPESYLR
jgi:hypothetical protein